MNRITLFTKHRTTKFKYYTKRRTNVIIYSPGGFSFGFEMYRRVLAVIVILAMISPPLFPSGQGQETDLVLRVAMQDDMKGLNPITNGDVWSNNVLRWIYDYPILIDYDTNEIIPYIAIGTANLTGKAESWNDCAIGNFGYSPQSTWANASKQEAIVFYDFENVTWHDGTPMTIRDVMFSLHLSAQVPEWSNPFNCLMDSYLAGVDWNTYIAWDPDTLHVTIVWEDGNKAALKFVLQTPYSNFFRNTISPMLLPYHIWGNTVSGQNVDGAKIWCDPGYNATSTDSWQVAAVYSYENDPPIGSGLFKFEYWETGQMGRIETYREHFYGPDYSYRSYIEANFPDRVVKQPTIDAITFNIYHTAEQAVWALKSGDIDYIAWAIPPTFFQELANEPNITLWSAPENGFFYLAYNMGRGSFGYNETGYDVGKPLRRAMSHCIDKNKIVQRLLMNLGLAGHGPISSISSWYNSSIPTYPFDPDAAKQILADAGYKVNNSGTLLSGDAARAAAGPDNWWVNPNGSKIGSAADGVIEILTPNGLYDPIRYQSSLFFAEQMRDIGINAETVAMDFGSIVNRMEQRDFDMLILGWSFGFLSEPSDYFYSLFHSSNIDIGRNYPGYRNESFDALIDLARETDDDEIRKKCIFEAQAAIAYDLPYDVLYFRSNIYAATTGKMFGWVSQEGTILNRDTIVNLRGPYLYSLNARFVEPPSAVLSNSTNKLAVIVSGEGLPMANARFTMNASIGKLSAEAGITNDNGKFSTNFTAPYVPPTAENILNGSMAFIIVSSATCDDPDYSPSPPRFIPVIVYPEGAKFISLNILADPDTISPDIAADGTAGFTYVTVGATDQDGIQLAGSSVTLSAVPGANPVNLTIEPHTAVTDSNGKAQFTVTAGDLPNNDSSVAEYVLKATAVHPDDANITGENSIVLMVVDANQTAPTDTAANSGLNEWVLPLTLVLIVLIALFVLIKRKRA